MLPVCNRKRGLIILKNLRVIWGTVETATGRCQREKQFLQVFETPRWLWPSLMAEPFSAKPGGLPPGIAHVTPNPNYGCLEMLDRRWIQSWRPEEPVYSLFHRLSNWQRNEDCYPTVPDSQSHAKRRGVLRMGALALRHVFLAGQGFAASVVRGLHHNFPAQPPAADWATLTIAGTGTDAYDTDADVNANVTTAVVTNQTIGAASNPPGVNSRASYSTIGFYLQTRPATASRYLTDGQVREQ